MDEQPHPFRDRPRFWFELRRRGSFERWTRWLWRGMRLSSGDPAFDQQWSMETRDHEFGEALIRDPEARAAIDALGQLGCRVIRRTWLSCISHELQARTRRHRGQSGSATWIGQQARLEAVIARLHAQARFPHRGLSLRALAFVVVGLIVGGAGALSVMDGELDLGGVRTRVILTALVIVGPFSLLAIRPILRHLGTQMDDRSDLLAMLLWGPIVLVALGIGTIVVLNRGLDAGPAVVHRMTAVRLQQQRVNRFTTRLEVLARDAADQGASTLTIPVTREQANLISVGTDCLRVTTSPGGLHFERLLDLQVDGSAPAR